MTESVDAWTSQEWPQAPQGARPGDVPEPVNWRPRVCIILPPVDSPSSRAAAKSIRDYSTEHDLAEPIVMRTIEKPNVYRDKFRLLRSSHAKGLYVAAHRERVFVVALTGGRVHLDPTEIPDRKNTVSIQEFIRFKCGYSYVESASQLSTALADALEYRRECRCDGFRDPRCLPFSLFASKSEHDLDSPAERANFMRDHQGAKTTDLTDRRRLLWQRQEFHTKELIHVAGKTLPLGFHWNVQVRSQVILTNGWERWEVMRNGYTNVHPDATIRGGDRAMRTFELTSSEPKVQPRLPRSVRSTRGRRRSSNTKN